MPEVPYVLVLQKLAEMCGRGLTCKEIVLNVYWHFDDFLTHDRDTKFLLRVVW